MISVGRRSVRSQGARAFMCRAMQHGVHRGVVRTHHQTGCFGLVPPREWQNVATILCACFAPLRSMLAFCSASGRMPTPCFEAPGSPAKRRASTSRPADSPATAFAADAVENWYTGQSWKQRHASRLRPILDSGSWTLRSHFSLRPPGARPSSERCWACPLRMTGRGSRRRYPFFATPTKCTLGGIAGVRSSSSNPALACWWGLGGSRARRRRIRSLKLAMPSHPRSGARGWLQPPSPRWFNERSTIRWYGRLTRIRWEKSTLPPVCSRSRYSGRWPRLSTPATDRYGSGVASAPMGECAP
jgi:hypothetical protein